MDNRSQSGIKPGIRDELLSECAMSAKPRQMSDGSVKITVQPNDKSRPNTSTTQITNYTEHRSCSLSSSSSGGIILTTDPSLVPPPKSPSLLKRGSSWKKFKNTVKETVTGIVNLSVGQTPTGEGDEDNLSKAPVHLCEHLTPDLEEKLIQCSTENIVLPPLEEMSSAMERLERQADAAFAAAAKFPQATPLMVTLPPTIQSHAPQLPTLSSKAPPLGITAVPQIVVTSDTPEARYELQKAAMSSPRKILKNVDRNNEKMNVNVPLSSSPPSPTSLSPSPPNSALPLTSKPLSFSNSMTNIPNLTKKRVSWGDVPPLDLPNTENVVPVTDQPSSQNKSDETNAEEKKRLARLKIKNALLGAAASAGNDNLSKVMQAHPSSFPIQTMSTTKKVEMKTAMLLPEPGTAPTRVRRLSDCGVRGEDIMGPSSKVGNSGTKIGRSSSLKKSKPKPMIWEHFDVVPNNSLQGRCRACHMTISCKHNTGQFVRHLQLAHMDIFRKYEHKIQTEWTKSIVAKTVAK